jgi:hypothetical protein
MSYNELILSYNKNKEIEEYTPDKSPCVSSNESKENNELIYHSFYIQNKMSLDQDRISTMNILRSNTNVNIFKPYSASPLVFSPKTKSTVNKIKNAVYSPKIKKFFVEKKIKNNIINNNNIYKNKLPKSKKTTINSIGSKKPRKKKLLNKYGSYRNIYENKTFNNKLKKMKTASVRKKEEVKEFRKDSSTGNITIKNENFENRIEFDKSNKKINIYIKNNIYNYNLLNEVNNHKINNLIESRSSFNKSDSIKIQSQDYTFKSNYKSSTHKKNNNKKPAIRITPSDLINIKNVNNNNTNSKNNIFLKEKEINNNKNINININNNKIKFDFPLLEVYNRQKKPIKILPIKFYYKKLLQKFHELYIKWKYYKDKNKIRGRINPLLNILSFLNQKDIIEIISLKNKKMMLLLNKSLIDSYYIIIKKNLKKYNNYLETIKSSLVYTYVKDRSSLKIDFILTIKFIDKNNKILEQNPKHFQLLYLFEFLKEKNNSKLQNKIKNKLYDCYGFDIIPEIINLEKESKKEFKGVYLSKQMSKFNIDKNDDMIIIQPILPFKLNDRGIFNFEIFSNQNYFINPKNMRIKLNILDLNANVNINELRINEYDNICKHWKKNGGLNAKKIEIYKNIIKEWFDKFFFIQDIFYADIGLSVFKFNLVANHCGVLNNENLNVKIIIKEKDDYVENEIKKNNLLFERNSSFEIRKGENIIFFLSM